jgi:hypothetical protein
MRQFKPGQLQTGSLYNISSSYALTASFALNGGGGSGTTINTGSFVTTSSFNAFTASYTTGSFTGSFKGDGSQLTGIVSSKWTGSNPISRQGDVEITGSLRVQGSITGSLFGTASWATNAATASYVNPLNQNVQLTGSLYLATPEVASVYFSGSSAASRLVWNDTDGTLNLGLKGGNVTLQVGQEQVVRAVNKTGTNLLESEYKAARIRRVDEGGSQGQRLAIVLAQADNDANSVDTLGLVTENIDVNQEGFITNSGLVRGINTTGALQGETWVDGDVLYLSPTTAGGITTTKPQAPQHTVIIGYVVYAHSNNGTIFVKVDNGYEIDELHNVKITTGSLTPGQLLVRSGSNATGVWINTNQLTGSYGLTGSLTATSFTGSLFGTSSWASNAVTASHAPNYVLTSATGSMLLPYVLTSNTASMTVLSSSFASTASYVLQAVSASYAPDTTFPYTGSALITGSLGVTGSMSLLATTSTTSTIFNVRNSASTANIIEARGNASIVFANGVSTYSLNPRTDADGFSLNSGNGLYGTGTGMEVVSNGFLINNSGSRTFRFTGASVTNLWEFRNESGQLRICPTTDTTNPIINLNGTTRFVGVGILTPAARLDVKAQGALSTDTVFRVRNSADTQNLMSITGDGRVAIGLNAQILGTTDAFKNVVIGGGAKDIASAGVTENAVAFGYNAVSNNGGTAIGANTSITGIQGVAIGASAIAGISSTAIGATAIADGTSGYQSLAIGFGARASALLSGIIAVGQSSYTNALGQTLAFCVDPSGANSQTMLLTNKANLVFRNSTQLTSGTHWDTTATNTLTIHSGSIPATTVSGAFQMYAATGSLTNNTRPHFRTGNGTTVWLGDESRLFNVTASRTIISSSQNTASGSSLTVYGSGSALPVFTVQGSQGELFSITDSLSGSLFSVNDISGLPILEVFSDNTTLIGNYLDPMLITTAKITQTNSGSFTVYSLPTASYDTAFFEYSVRSGSNARAGTIMAIQSGSSVNFTETTTTDFGNTSAVSFGVFITGSNMALTGSSTSGAWTTKCIVRGI